MLLKRTVGLHPTHSLFPAILTIITLFTSVSSPWLQMKVIFTHLFFAEWDSNEPTAPKECNVGAHFLSNCLMEGSVSPRADIRGSDDWSSGSESRVLSSNLNYASDSWNTFRTTYWTFNLAIYSHTTYSETPVYPLLFLRGLADLSGSSQFALYFFPVSQTPRVLHKLVFIYLFIFCCEESVDLGASGSWVLRAMRTPLRFHSGNGPAQGVEQPPALGPDRVPGPLGWAQWKEFQMFLLSVNEVCYVRGYSWMSPIEPTVLDMEVIIEPGPCSQEIHLSC